MEFCPFINIIMKKGEINMKNEQLRKEHILRKSKKEEVYDIVGAEIKDARLRLRSTQQELADDICSLSYLCKVEKNKIVPNKIFMKEICQRLNIKESKINMLLQLRMTLEDCVKAFLKKDVQALKTAVEKGEGLNNYRFKIIKLIYFIAIKDLVEANRLSKELLKIITSMAELDFVIYSLFDGILQFYNQDFEQALDNLQALDNYLYCQNDIRLLQLKYKFYLNYLINCPSCIFDYKELTFRLFIEGYLEQLDEIHYVMGMYLLKNKCFCRYKDVFKVIHTTTYRRSLSLLAKFIISPRLKIKEEWIEDVEPFFYYLGLIKIDKKRAKMEIDKLNDLSFNIDFNLLILQYLCLDTVEEKYKFLFENVLNTLKNSKNVFLQDYFLKQASQISRRSGKYKMFNEMFKAFKEQLW